MDSQESSIERGTHVSNNDDTCCEIIHSNDELENKQRTYITLFTPVLCIFSDTIPQLYVPYFTKGLLYPEMSPSYTVV
jgi:hypothetical protein